jgi:hypothetical protein
LILKRNDLPARDFTDGLHGATGENDNVFEYDLQSISALGLFTPASVLVIVVIFKCIFTVCKGFPDSCIDAFEYD